MDCRYEMPDRSVDCFHISWRIIENARQDHGIGGIFSSVKVMQLLLISSIRSRCGSTKLVHNMMVRGQPSSVS